MLSTIVYKQKKLIYLYIFKIGDNLKKLIFLFSLYKESGNTPRTANYVAREVLSS